MTGKLGAVRTVAKPSALVLSEALALVRGFGNDRSELASVLEEVRDAQEANQALIVEARDAVAEADQRLAAAAAAEANAKRAAAELEARLEKREAELGATTQRNAENFAALEKRLKEREVALTQAEEDFAVRDMGLSEREGRLAAREDEVDRQESEVVERLRSAQSLEAEWREKAERLRAFGSELTG